MKLKLSGSNMSLPLSDAKVLQGYVTKGLCPCVVSISETLGGYGFSRYSGADVVDIVLLNAVLSKLNNIQEHEFSEVCAIIESQYDGDLTKLDEAFVLMLTNSVEFISNKELEDYQVNEFEKYTQTKSGVIRIRGKEYGS